MGEWYDYQVYLSQGNNPVQNIKELLVKDGYITFTDKKVTRKDENGEFVTTIEKTPYLELEKIDSKIEELKCDPSFSSLKDYYRFSRVTIGLSNKISIRREEYEIPSLCYCSKWVSNEAIILALSMIYPEEIFGVFQTTTYWYEDDYNYFIKNNSCVNKKGEKVMPLVFNREQNFKDYDDTRYKISLPLGENPDKWGTIIVPKEDVSILKNEIWFLKDKPVTITFKYSPPLTLSPDELISLYSEKKDSYRELMRRKFIITNLAEEEVIRKTEPYNSNRHYYVVKIPVSLDTSENGYISVCVPGDFVDLEQNKVTVGMIGDYKHVMIRKDGEMQRVDMKVKDIEDAYIKATSLQYLTSITEQTEPEEEQEDMSIDI